jgi:hypothetical protein
MVFTALLAMVFALTFAWTAMAADDPCYDCGKCPLRQIKCCISSGQETPYTTYFDYETGYGYCSTSAYDSDCKVIFNLCNCESPNTNFVSGKKIGIRMEILTSGVYWSDVFPSMAAYTSGALACAGTSTTYTWTWNQIDYYDKAGSKLAAAVPIATTSCEVPCDRMAVELQSKTDTGYTIPAEMVTNEVKYWWIDVPPMFLNDSEIEGRAGETVTIEVCLQGATGGICRECNDICCCTIDVGTLCCETGDQTCIYFPYVVSGILPWWSGVAIVNYGGTSSLDLTLTLTDSTGAKFTWVKAGHTAALWTFILDQVLSNFSGTPAVGAAMLKVESDQGWIDGYSFLTDGTFGGSTLARGCCVLCTSKQ